MKGRRSLRLLAMTFLVIFGTRVAGPAAAEDTGSELSPSGEGNCALVKTWESGFNNQSVSEVVVGDPDGDRRASIFVPYFFSPGGAALLEYENSGDDTFKRGWSDKPGEKAITSLAIGDLDADGRGEIIAGHYSQAIRIFESRSGSFTELPPFPALGGGPRFSQATMKDLEVADTNGDGKQEVIVVQRQDTFPGKSMVTIFSHDGHLLYSWYTPSFLASATTGYFDDDEHLDIFVSHGGFGLGILYIDWIEHTGLGYARRRIYLDPYVGDPSAIKVADIDGTGSEELLIAGGIDGQSQLFVLSASGDNDAVISQRIVYQAENGPSAMDVGHVWDSEYPDIGIATYKINGMGQVFFFRFNGEEVAPVCHTGSELAESNYSFYSIDLTFIDDDNRADVVLTAQYEPKALVLESLTDLSTHRPDIKVNGSDGPVVLPRGSPLSLTASLDSDVVTAPPLEAWLVAVRKRPAPAVTYSFRRPGGWSPGLVPAFAGRAARFDPIKVLDTSSLPPGLYNIYFGVDFELNGKLDRGSLKQDRVSVEILP